MLPPCLLLLSPTASDIISIFGLTANFVGGILLWKYGIPNQVTRSGGYRLVTGQPIVGMRAKVRFYDRMSGFGLSLLIVGFVVQLFEVMLG
jgi:hypothetical protein